MMQITLDDKKIIKYNIDKINIEYIYSDKNPFIKRIFTKSFNELSPDFSKEYLNQISQNIKGYIYEILGKDKICIKYENINYVNDKLIKISKNYENEQRICKSVYIFFEDSKSAKRLFDILSKKLN